MHEARLSVAVELVARDQDEDDVQDRLSDFIVWWLESLPMQPSLFSEEKDLNASRYEIRAINVGENVR